MSKDMISLTIQDLSGFARALRNELTNPPSHQETLSLVARAAGYRNYEHLRARNAPAPQANQKLVERAALHFDTEGRLLRWPARTRIQGLCLWVIWAALPPRATLNEREISARIDALCCFQDAAQIRRAMVGHGQVTRSRDGAAYDRVEQAPPPEARALITRVKSPM